MVVICWNHSVQRQIDIRRVCLVLGDGYDQWRLIPFETKEQMKTEQNHD
jgi:hypothetical protein